MSKIIWLFLLFSPVISAKTFATDVTHVVLVAEVKATESQTFEFKLEVNDLCTLEGDTLTCAYHLGDRHFDESEFRLVANFDYEAFGVHEELLINDLYFENNGLTVKYNLSAGTLNLEEAKVEVSGTLKEIPHIMTVIYEGAPFDFSFMGSPKSLMDSDSF